MTPVHRAIISYLRPKLTQNLGLLSEQQILLRMFLSEHTLRLTNFGLHIMQAHFQHCRIEVPDHELNHATHILFLDTTAKMPYFCGEAHLVVFDHVLGFKLRLVEGRISVLSQIEPSSSAKEY